MSQLFRQEAVDHHRQQRLYGDVLISLSLANWLTTGLLVAIFMLLLLGLVFGSMARRETVSGWIRPNMGILQIQAPEPGLVEAIEVKEGDVVKAGAPLVALRLDQDFARGESYARQLGVDLGRERAHLAEQIDAINAQFTLRQSRMHAELEGIGRELAQYKRQADVLDDRIALARRQVDQRQGLAAQGFVSKLDLEKLQELLLSAQSLKEEILQDSYGKETRAKAMRIEAAALPHDRSVAVGAIRERIAAVDQRMTELARRSRVVLAAPSDGRVANVSAVLGQVVGAKTALLDVLPTGATLQVELFAPSRAIGLLIIGSEVQLRYDAFPYQKYGVGRGRISRIGKSPMDTKDMPRTIAGEEPVYRIVVDLDQPFVRVVDGVHPLEAGMTLKADLILERKRIGEYIFAPFFGAFKRA